MAASQRHSGDQHHERHWSVGGASDGSSSAKAKDDDQDASRMPSVVINTEKDPEQAVAVHEKEQDPGRSMSMIYEASTSKKILLTAIMTGASFLNTASVQAVVIVLPSIAKDLDVPPAQQQWIVSAYSLPVACFVLLWSRLADVYGRRLVFLTGMVGVTIFLLVNPFVPNQVGFDIIRALHGLSAAANVPTAIGILGTAFPPGPAKTYAISCFSAGFPIGSVIGNILGGVIGQYAGWHWVFWIQAILAFVITCMSFWLVPSMKAPLSSRSTFYVVDFLGGALITSALLCLLFALTFGNEVGWDTAWVIVLIILGVSLIAAFAAWERYLELTDKIRPLMKMSIWRNPRFAAAQVMMATFFAAFNTFLYFATYYYQLYQGLDIIETTLRFIPTGVVGLMTSIVASQLIGRVHAVYILVFGNICVAISCLLFAVPIPGSTSYWAYAFEAMCLCVIGADTLFPCITLFTIQSLPQEDQAMGGGIVNAMGQTGRAIGLAIAIAISLRVQESHPDPNSKEALVAGYHAAEYFNFALGMTGAVIAVVSMRKIGIIGVQKK